MDEEIKKLHKETNKFFYNLEKQDKLRTAKLKQFELDFLKELENLKKEIIESLSQKINDEKNKNDNNEKENH